MLLPVLLVGLGCTICFLYVMTKSPREMPEMDFADEPKMPRAPSMAMTLVSSPVAVKLEYVPKFVPPPKEEKKKWDTVATGTYMRDGQHTAVKWGKFGEAGGTAMNELDAEEEEEEEEEEVDDLKLHEDIFVEVETPDIPRTLGKVRKSPAFSSFVFTVSQWCSGVVVYHGTPTQHGVLEYFAGSFGNTLVFSQSLTRHSTRMHSPNIASHTLRFLPMSSFTCLSSFVFIHMSSFPADGSKELQGRARIAGPYHGR